MLQEFSKTSMIHLTRLIRKPWTMFTGRVHSRLGPSQVSPGHNLSSWSSSGQNLTQNTLIILYYQEPASGVRTLPGPSPAPLWQRRSVEMLTRAWGIKTFGQHCDGRWVARRWRPPPLSTPCVMATWGSGAPSPSDNRRGESHQFRVEGPWNHVFRKTKQEQFSLMNITGTAEDSESNARF